MNTTQTRVLASLRTADAFLDDNAARIAGKLKPALRARLTLAMTDLASIITEQQSLTRAVTGSARDRAATRTALVRDHMAPIARVARLELSSTPAIAQFTMPKTRLSTEKLAAAAHGMARAAVPYTDVFIAAALPDDFVAQLTAATDAMLAFNKQRATHANRRTGMTSGLGAKLRDARTIVHAVDAIVRSVLTDDPILLATWESASRVQQGRTSGAVPAPAPPGASPAPAASDAAPVPVAAAA